MKATGIVRRIDDLGRVVIPKEIRRSMRVREGDPLEIYTNGEYICFKRYSSFETIKEEIKKVLDVASGNCVVYDRDGEKVVSAPHNFTATLEELSKNSVYKILPIYEDCEEIGYLGYGPSIEEPIAEYMVKLIAKIASGYGI